MRKIIIISILLVLAASAPATDKMNGVPVPLSLFRASPLTTAQVFTVAILTLPVPIDLYIMSLLSL